MPKFAVILRYDIVSGLVIEAANEEEATERAIEFEAAAHDSVIDADDVAVSARVWGGESTYIAEADDDEDAEEIINDWIDDLEIDGDFDDEDFDEDDDDEDDSDEDDDEDEDDSEEPASADDAEKGSRD